jgi:dihydropyrimidinase
VTKTYDVAVAGARVVVPTEGVLERTLAIAGERIADLVEPSTPVRAHRMIDGEGKVVLPGVIDPHTHIGYEGYRGIPLEAVPEHFRTETASALIGGVTTLLCTYRNASPYQEIWGKLTAAGERNSLIDFGYSLGITNDNQLAGIPLYAQELGVTSFKFYMAYRGEEAKATGNVYNTYDDGLLYEGMEAIARVPGGVAMVHPENIEIIERIRRRYMNAGRDDLSAWSESRPDFTEAENIRRALYLGEQVNCAVYIPHLSCRKSLDAVREHRARGTTPAYIETCPHYLTHTKDAPIGLLGKVNPPLREERDRTALWSAMAAGDVDTVGTDHCGVRREVKSPDIWTAVPGFPGMATLLPVLLTGVARGLLDLRTVATVTALRTAEIFNLAPRKGSLLPGSDADIVMVDPGLTRRVSAGSLGSRSDFSIYEGEELTGWPVLTMVRGRVAMEEGRVLSRPGDGRYLSRRADENGGVS